MTTILDDNKFRQLVDALPQIIWISNPKGGLEYTNEQWSKYTGLTLEESLQGKLPISYIHPDDRPAITESWRRALETGSAFEQEMRIRRADGRFEWFLSRCLPVRDEHQRIQSWFGTSTNIDVRKRSEQDQAFMADTVVKLRKMRDATEIGKTIVRILTDYLHLDLCALVQYALHTEQVEIIACYRPNGVQGEVDKPDSSSDSPDAHLSSNGKRDLAKWAEAELSRHALEMLGTVVARELEATAPFAVDDLTEAQAFRAFFDEEMRGFPRCALLAATAQESAQHKVFVIGVQNHTRAWHKREKDLLQNFAGSAWLAYQRSASEMSLVQQQRTLELALEMAQMATWEYNFATNQIGRSASLDHIFGLPQAEGPRSLEEYFALIHVDDRESFTAAVEEAVTTDRPFRVEFRVVPRGGPVRWMATRGAVMRDGEGTPVRLSGALVDITERKTLEMELEQRVTLAQFQALVGAILTGQGDLRTLLQKCTQAIVDTFDAAFARIWTLNSFEQVLELQASAGLYTRLDGSYSRIPVGMYKIGRIAQEKGVYLTNDVANDPAIRDPAWARREGMVAFAGRPLLIEGEVVGVMGMFARHPLSDVEMQAMEAVSNKLALTIERKWAEAEEARLLGVLEASLNEIYIFDSHTLRFSYVNEGARQNLGYSAEELLMLTPLDLKPEFTETSFRAMIEPLLQQQKDKLIFETVHRRANATLYPVEVHLQLVEKDGTEVFLAVINDITERKQAEETLRRQEKRFRVLIENAPDAIALLSADGRLKYVSPSILRILGYATTEVEGRMATRFIHPDDLPMISLLLSDLMQHPGKVVDSEYRFQHRDGSWRWLESTISNLLDEPSVEALVFNFRDVTVRRMFEKSLRESEERFRLALEGSPITVYTTDAELRYTWLYNSPQHLDAEDVIGKRDDEIYSAEGAKELMAVKSEVLETGQAVRRVVQVADDRHYAEYDLSAEPLYNAKGEITGLTVAATDITEREQAEARLAFLAAASELLVSSLDYTETFKRLAQAIVPEMANWCAIDLLNDKGGLDQVVVVHENPEMVALAREMRRRYPPTMKEVQGVANVIRTGRSEIYPVITDELLRMATKSEEQYEFTTKVGMRSAIVVPLRAREQVLGAITLVWSDSLRNYTEADLRFAEELARRASVAIENSMLYREARQAEAELRRFNETLEQRVQERTRELERSNLELDQFAYVASHDLKAPLRAVEHLASWIEADAGTVLPEQSHEHLNKLRGRIARMESLLDDLLTYSRAGQVRGDAVPVDTRELVERVIEIVAPPEDFKIEIDESMPRLLTYRAPLETVFRNLIGNAIKHHTSSEGRIWIMVNETSDLGEGWVEFAVSDDGPGIAPEFHARVYQMFQTLRPRDSVEGSGIGLAVVKKIVESVGGATWVESELDQGTTFYFTWPKTWRRDKLE